MKTTKKQFKEFCAECRKWIKKFGLTEWEIYFYHEKIDAAARVVGSTKEMTADILLSTEIEGPVFKTEIKRCAFHEVCELLLLDVRTHLDFVFCKGEIDNLLHKIIYRLQNTYFEIGMEDVQ